MTGMIIGINLLYNVMSVAQILRRSCAICLWKKRVMMNKHEIMTGVLLSEGTTFTVVEVCEYCDLPEDILKDWIAHGLFGDPHQPMQFDYKMIDRIRTAHRLQNDLEVNLQGVILALELMDEMAKLQEELAILKRGTM